MCCSVFDLTFHGQWHLLQVRRQLPCSDGFACPGNRCHYWIGGSKVEKVFFQAVLVIWPTWVQISTPTAAVQELQLWNSCQLPWFRMVLGQDCAVEKRCGVVGRHQFSRCIPAFSCVRKDLAFLIVDSTFRQRQRHLFRVRLPCWTVWHIWAQISAAFVAAQQHCAATSYHCPKLS